jgi:hypothetical protein
LRWGVCPVVHYFVDRLGLEIATKEKQTWRDYDEFRLGEEFRESSRGRVRFWGRGDQFAGADDKTVGGRAEIVKGKASD